MKKLHFVLLLFFSVMLLSAQDFKPQLGLLLKGSSNGLGVDAYYRPMKVLALKLGYEAFNFNVSNQTLQDNLGDVANLSLSMPNGSDMNFGLDATLKTGSFSASVGYQPFALLYFTAGIGSFLLHGQATGTPITDLEFGSQNVPNVGTISPLIEKEKLGDFSLELNPSLKVAPYLGLGLGSYVPRNKKLSFALELGAFYMGAPSIKFNLPPGLKSENINYGSNITEAQKQQYFGDLDAEIDGFIDDMKTELNNQVEDVNEQLKPFAFYPVLKLTIGFKAYEFK